MTTNWPLQRRTAWASAFVAMAALAAPDAQALTLGRAFVQSQLGEAMRAEVEFESLTPEEAESLRATVVSAEGYREVGVDYNPALAGARVVLQRLANAKPSLRVTTNRIIQEPFVELMIEVTWRGGRLVRSYTLLFDLPSNRNVATPAAIGAAGGTVAAEGPSAMAPAGPSATDESRPGRDGNVRQRPERRGPPPAGAPAAPASVPDPYRVRDGDTLSELAQRGPRPAGVSLDRLVLALYRDNPDAFLGGNMHRLRKGVVLKAPSADTVAATTDAEARQIIRAQSADFNGYRGRLAAMPAERTDTADQRASGKVQAAVDDRKLSAAPTPDKLTLSKEAAARDAAREAAASKERERKDAAARMAELSKNVQELGKLNSALGGASASAPPSPSSTFSPAASTPTTARAAAAGASAPQPGINLPSTGPALPASAPKPPAATVATPAPASAPLGAASAAASASKPAAPPAKPPTEEPGFIEGLLSDNLPAAGLAGVLIALLAGVGIFKLVKRRRDTVADTSFLESRLKPDSFFGASGAQHVDTREVASAPNSSSMMNYSLSQLDAIGDVDPVAEADVYLAYGRDLQAEEILKEAKRTTPDRLAIHTKLLEVYAKRRDVKGFEELAMELYATTNGQGDDWAKACDMGRQIDPENDLYRQGSAASLVTDRTAPLSRGFEEELLGTPTQPQAMIAAPPAMSAPPAEPPLSKSFELDLDLDLGAMPSQPATIPLDSRPAPLAAAVAPATPAPAPYAPPADDMISFDGALDFSPPPAAAASPAAAPATAPTAVPAAPAADPLPFSTSAFSLDLDLPDLGAAGGASAAGPGPTAAASPAAPDSLLGAVDFDSNADSGADPLARKLELADEFRQIGDMEGARDLLQEVIDGASGALKAKAEAMLAGLN